MCRAFMFRSEGSDIAFWSGTTWSCACARSIFDMGVSVFLTGSRLGPGVSDVAVIGDIDDGSFGSPDGVIGATGVGAECSGGRPGSGEDDDWLGVTPLSTGCLTVCLSVG